MLAEHLEGPELLPSTHLPRLRCHLSLMHSESWHGHFDAHVPAALPSPLPSPCSIPSAGSDMPPVSIPPPAEGVNEPPLPDPQAIALGEPAFPLKLGEPAFPLKPMGNPLLADRIRMHVKQLAWNGHDSFDGLVKILCFAEPYICLILISPCLHIQGLKQARGGQN